MSTLALSLPRRFALRLRARVVALQRRYTPIRCYTVRASHEWAIIYLDEHRGSFTCQSTCGNYAYIWRAIGDDTLKEFLRDLNFDYFMGKTRPRYREFDCERSIENIREHIITIRRDGSIDKQTAREAWSDLDYIDDNNGIRFVDGLARSPALIAVLGSEYYEFAREVPDADSRRFWEVIWPAFLNQIGGRKP